MYILLMCSAGLRRGALPGLRIGDLQKIEKYSFYKISVFIFYNAMSWPEEDI